jgi:hAT family C-terminal dimerisation region
VDEQQLMKRDTNVLKYWASKEYEYPIIARIARDHLAIPATLAASKSVFSIDGDIITKKRNKLGGYYVYGSRMCQRRRR